MTAIPLRIRIRSAIARVVRRKMIRRKDEFLQLAKQSCRDVQRKTLAGLLQLNADSRYSQSLGLNADLSVSQFRQRYPVADYENFRSAIDEMTQGDHRALLGQKNPLLMYAVTSGTTAKSKLISVTRRFVDDYRRGWQHWGMGVFQSHPRLSQRRMVQISSSHDRQRTADGIPCGNISGLASSMQKRIVQKLYSVPVATAGLLNAESKRRAIATFALADPWVGMFITANPSTLLQLLAQANESAEAIIRDIHDGQLRCVDPSDAVFGTLSQRMTANPTRAQELHRVMERHGELKPTECWPKMVCLGVWTGGSAAAYLPQLRTAFPNIPIRDHGLHASEGRMTIPFEDNTAAGVLDIESHFFEFIPVAEATSTQPVVLESHELQDGGEYFILLTTASGLYRYNMFDVVRCTGFFGTTPMLEFLHKGAHISSITGEKITESQVVAAVQTACGNVAIAVRQFTLTPAWGEPPGYCLYVAAANGQTLVDDQLCRLAESVDAELRRLNCEYEEKRATSRLHSINCEALPDSDWRRYAERRLARSGGSPEQYKHPCLVPDSRFEGVFMKDCRPSVQ